MKNILITGGQGHVNEQNQDYILDMMGKYGLKYDNKLSQILKEGYPFG